MALTTERKRLLTLVGIALVTQALLFVPLPAWAHVLFFLLWAGVIPGHLLAEVVGREFGAPPTRLEWGLYAVGAGYSLIIGLLLLLSAIPGPLLGWHVHVGVDVLLLILVAAAWPVAGRDAVPVLPLPRAELLALAAILAVAAALRLPYLGYAEFHGDEARAVLRAAAVIQGYDDVLYLHRKGPAEILLPTAVFLATGHITEATARLPFALANLTALGAIFWLGRRLFAHASNGTGALVGLGATLFLAVDGFFVAFSRVVQYQSIVILMSALTLLVLVRLWQAPRGLAGGLALAAIFLATGLWAHYEAGLVAVPALLLIVAIWRQAEAPRRALLRGLGVATVVGALLLAIFYVPFIAHPQFQGTFTYLFDRRIGGEGFPTNNIGDFATRLTTYSSVYYALALIVAVTLAMWLAYRRVLGPRRAWVAGLLPAVVVVLTAWRPEWAQAGGHDWLVLAFVAALLPLWLLPGLHVAERFLWAWWGAGLVFILFFTAKPRTHVYVFFTSWALLVGTLIAQGVARALRDRPWRQLVAPVVALAVGITLLFGGYVAQLFVVNRVEVLRMWETNWPVGYLRPFERLDNRALFGFPLAYGWKAVGELYRQGVIDGDYITNEVEFWAPIWYTHGRMRCDSRAEWAFVIDPPQPDPAGYRAAVAQQLADRGYAPQSVVTLRNDPRLTLYGREPTTLLPPAIALEPYAASFDAHATPDLPLGYPVVEPEIRYPLQANFGGLIQLEGYDLDAPAPLSPGEPITLTLFWRALAPITESYKVFNQSFYGDGVMVAQQDGYPVCGARGTWQWDPGDQVVDVHILTIRDDAPDGLYPLFTGLYLESTMRRLRILDSEGNPGDDRVQLTAIRIGPE